MGFIRECCTGFFYLWLNGVPDILLRRSIISSNTHLFLFLLEAVQVADVVAGFGITKSPLVIRCISKTSNPPIATIRARPIITVLLDIYRSGMALCTRACPYSFAHVTPICSYHYRLLQAPAGQVRPTVGNNCSINLEIPTQTVIKPGRW